MNWCANLSYEHWYANTFEGVEGYDKSILTGFLLNQARYWCSHIAARSVVRKHSIFIEGVTGWRRSALNHKGASCERNCIIFIERKHARSHRNSILTIAFSERKLCSKTLNMVFLSSQLWRCRRSPPCTSRGMCGLATPTSIYFEMSLHFTEVFAFNVEKDSSVLAFCERLAKPTCAIGISCGVCQSSVTIYLVSTGSISTMKWAYIRYLH